MCGCRHLAFSDWTGIQASGWRFACVDLYLMPNWMLYDVTGASDMGANFGDVSEPGARARYLGLGVGTVAFFVLPDLHISDHFADARIGRYFLAVRSNLPTRLLLHPGKG